MPAAARPAQPVPPTPSTPPTPLARLARTFAEHLFTRRPALPAALLLMAGIAAHAALPHRPASWTVLLAAFAVVPFLFRSRLAASLALTAAAFLLGVTVAQREAFYFPADHICHYSTDGPRLARVRLRVLQPPRTLSHPFAPFHTPQPKQVTIGEVLAVKTPAGWAEASGTVQLQVDRPDSRLALGQVVEAFGHLQRPAPALNPGQFDYEAYYREQRILVCLTIPRPENLIVLDQGSPPLLGRLRESVRRLLDAGFPAESIDHATDHATDHSTDRTAGRPAERSLDHALLRALLLGDADPELRDVQDHFRRVGVSYQLCVSGLHVVVLGGFVFFLCRLLRLRPRLSVLVGLAFVVLYGVVALPATPVIRAVLLWVVFGLGVLLKRSCDRLQLLALAVAIMLLIHPLDLYAAGFQLSFGTVLGIVVLTRPVLNWMHDSWWIDQRIAMSFRRPRPWGRFIWWAKWRLAESFAFGILGWLVSAPLIARHFDQLNPWAIPAALLMFPLVFAGLVAGLAKVVLTLLLPNLAGTWASLAAAPIAWMRHGADWLSKLPGADVPLAPPPLWAMALWYGTLCLLVMPYPHLRPPTVGPLAPLGPSRTRLRLCVRCGAAALAVLLLAFPLLAGFAPVATAKAAGTRPTPPTAAPAGECRATLLAVGAGQVGVVELPSGRVVLIDAGSSSLTDPLRSCLVPFLRRRGVRRIDSIFLSHPDYDHISAAAEAVEAYGVRDVFVNPYFRPQSAGNAPALALLNQLDAARRPPRVIAAGDSFPLDDQTTLRVLWPPPGRPALTTNNAGLVLRLECRGRSILFPADIQGQTEMELLKLARRDPALLSADVLVAPHHGSAESTTADFIRAVSPRLIVASNDRKLSHKQLEFDRIAAGWPVYRTSRCGAISIVIDRGGAVSVETFLSQPAAEMAH